MPSGIGMTRYATAAQILRQGACEPPGDLSNTSYPIISVSHDGISCFEPGTRLLRRRECGAFRARGFFSRALSIKDTLSLSGGVTGALRASSQACHRNFSNAALNTSIL
jgi:hypothetical protein